MGGTWGKFIKPLLPRTESETKINRRVMVTSDTGKFLFERIKSFVSFGQKRVEWGGNMDLISGAGAKKVTWGGHCRWFGDDKKRSASCKKKKKSLQKN